MDDLPLIAAQTIVASALTHGRDAKFKPLAVAVLDARGVLKAFAAEDGASLGRASIAIGKASGAIAMGLGSRAIATRSPQFLSAVAQLLPNGMVAVPGGVLIRAGDGTLVGAVGVSGDTSENDEAAALTGIAAAGLVGDSGAES